MAPVDVTGEAVKAAPGIVAQLREHAGAMRDMTPAEVAACDALLRDVRREAEGTP